MLALVGHVIAHKDHIDAIFNGLPPEYDILEISVNSGFGEHSVEEIESLILAQEVRIERAVKISDGSNLASNLTSANLAMAGGTSHSHSRFWGSGFEGFNSSYSPHTSSSHGSYNGSFSPFSDHSFGGFSSRQNSFSGNSNSSSRGKFSGRGRGNVWNKNKVQCPSQFNHQLQGNLAQCQSTSIDSAQMGAMLAAPEAITDSAWYLDVSFNMEWYPDSGATNHLTADPSNLMSSLEFYGPD
ncbi:uncharacterized protein LOC112094390 [Morus notabilis]|uniref:uncharacterized protein LOC112094390 n=1 Tax=Morus notabilis TaxID=981085 RepID=UPI000CED1AF3|nr:uncharacterized protein LOC112094390 [Morus notabilis]